MRKSIVSVALALALFFLIVGAKWATFDRFGSPMPDWDQWDAEAVELFIPWFEHDHFVSHLFHPHNEHRVVLTKLQNLALVLLNGQWDSRLEAVTNAMLHAALAVAFWVFARKWVARRWDAPLFVLAFALFGLPLAWQNILGGFHSQQYWLLGLSFAAIVALPFAPAWSAPWWIGTATAILALGSMGSGFLAAAVVVVLLLWRVVRGEISLRATWPTFALMTALVIVGLVTRVEVDWHQKLKAKTVHDFVFSIVHSLQWPLRDRHWAAAVLWLPWAIVGWHVLRASRRTELRFAQAVVALGGWTVVQIVATAYARGAGADYPASRYMDTLAFGTMANGLALAWLLSPRPEVDRIAKPSWTRFVMPLVAVTWIVTLGLGLHEVLERNLRYELPDAKKYYIKAEGHMRRYLATNDPKQLAHPDIPFPSADGLVERLARPSLRQLMPLPIRAPLPLARSNSSGEAKGFRENNGINADVDNPPRDGLSPQTAPLDYTTSWGSFSDRADASSQARWSSEPLAASIGGWLKFEVAGNIGRDSSDVGLELRDARTGGLIANVVPSKTPGDTWRAAYVRAPAAPFVVVAHDNSARQWVAFSPPVEMAGWSYWAWQATKHGLLVFWASLGLAVATLAGMWVGRRQRRDVASEPHRATAT